MRKIRIILKNLEYKIGRKLLVLGTLGHHSLYGGVKDKMHATTLVKAGKSEWKLSFDLIRHDDNNGELYT